VVPLRLLQGAPADSIRRAAREVFARPEYQWAPAHRPLHWYRDLLDWFSRFTTAHPVGSQVVFWVCLALLIALLVHLGFTVWRIYRVTVQRPAPVLPGALAAPLDARAHLARADALARAGRFTEALAHRFAALLLELDRADALKFHPSKTPAEYVREARLSSEARGALSVLVARLYQHVFGMAPCDEQCYRDFGMMAGSVGRHVVPH
jgi:uncharacterized protein DUF4129